MEEEMKKIIVEQVCNLINTRGELADEDKYTADTFNPMKNLGANVELKALVFTGAYGGNRITTWYLTDGEDGIWVVAEFATWPTVEIEWMNYMFDGNVTLVARREDMMETLIFEDIKPEVDSNERN